MSTTDSPDPVRGFIQSSRAWYAASTLRDADFTEEVMFGLFHPDGGMSGEIAIRWDKFLLDGVSAAYLHAFHDSWQVLAGFPDVLIEMAKFNDENPTVTEVIEMLLRLGFKDMTRETQ